MIKSSRIVLPGGERDPCVIKEFVGIDADEQFIRVLDCP